MKTTLVIMAAGMGSRYGGGIKQLQHVGPSGEILMDYSIYDAIQAGFNKVVIVIRKDIEQEFRTLIGDKISKFIDIEYVFQDINNIPKGFSVPEGRTKPWGTGHAILACEGHIDTPFAIINADDFYGREAFVKIHDFLADARPSNEYCMAGYILGNTLSDHGTVTRGVCSHNKNMYLSTVNETYKLQFVGGKVTGETRKGEPVEASIEDLVSMNMWGCNPRFIDVLKRDFSAFLADDSLDPLKKEYLLPTIIDKLIKKQEVRVKILPVNERWFGLTYAEDKPIVINEINKMISAGVYPDNLWNI